MLAARKWIETGLPVRSLERSAWLASARKFLAWRVRMTIDPAEAAACLLLLQT
jgi:hypothetical protein